MGADQCSEEFRALNLDPDGGLGVKRDRLRGALYPCASSQLSNSILSQPALPIQQSQTLQSGDNQLEDNNQWLLIKQTGGPVYTRIPKASHEKSCRG